MMGRPAKREAKLFYVGVDLEQRIPQDHPLRRIRQGIDFSFVRPLTADCYGHNGHEGLDPTVLLKLLFLCFYENLRSERAMMEQLPYRLDWLWFCELDLDSPVPNHSVLSKARQRWGLEVFEGLFARVLKQCIDAGLVEGSTLHVDSTLLRANASLEQRISRRLWEQLQQAAAPADAAARAAAPAPQAARAPEAAPPVPAPAPAPTPSPTPIRTPPAAEDTQAALLPPPPQGAVNQRLVSPADPDAAVATRRNRGPVLGYRDHRLVDDAHGVILATLATPADYDDGSMLPVLLQQQWRYGWGRPEEVVGDSMYGTQMNYARLQQQQIRPYLKKRRGKDSPKVSWLKLLPPGCTPARARQLLGRRKAVAEGSFAEAHVLLGHARCRWRRRWRVQIQCFLVATVQNVKKLLRRRPGGGARGMAQALVPAGVVQAGSVRIGAAAQYCRLRSVRTRSARCAPRTRPDRTWPGLPSCR